MSDLVKRLREVAHRYEDGELCVRVSNEAADEIERLTRELAEASRQRDDMFAYQESVSENLIQITEVYDEACDSAAIPRGDRGILTPWYRVKLMAAALAVSRLQVAALREALVWMTGSADFGPGGQAHEAFERDVQPLLADTAAAAQAHDRARRIEGWLEGWECGYGWCVNQPTDPTSPTHDEAAASVDARWPKGGTT